MHTASIKFYYSFELRKITSSDKLKLIQDRSVDFFVFLRPIQHDSTNFSLSCFAVSLTDHGSFEDEHLDGFSNGLTNASTGVVIGGSGSGVVMICFCVLIYFLYRLLRSPPRIEPMPDRKTEAFIIPLHSRNAARTEPDVIYVREAEAVANSNGAPCPGCRNVCSSPHLAWSEPEFPMEECICMSAPPPYS